MMKKNDKIFEVSDNKIPLFGFSRVDGTDYRSVIEKDEADLARKLAETKLSLSESEHKYTNDMKSILLSILDVVDAFDEVFSAIDEKKDELTQSMRAYVANFRTRYRMLSSILSDRQVVQIDNIGDKFDPCWHHAVDHVEDASKENGVIVKMTKKGYFWKDQVLRKVWVIVVRNPK